MWDSEIEIEAKRKKVNFPSLFGRLWDCCEPTRLHLQKSKAIQADNGAGAGLHSARRATCACHCVDCMALSLERCTWPGVDRHEYLTSSYFALASTLPTALPSGASMDADTTTPVSREATAPSGARGPIIQGIFTYMQTKLVITSAARSCMKDRFLCFVHSLQQRWSVVLELRLCTDRTSQCMNAVKDSLKQPSSQVASPVP